MTATTPGIVSPDLYAAGIPDSRFTEIRHTPGLAWHDYEDGGFWVISRHVDMSYVSAHPELFSSAVGHTNLWDLEADALEARRSIIDSDAPDHTRLRRVVSAAFTPRNLKVWEDVTREITAEALSNYIDNGGGDWVETVAAPIPINVIMNILGVPLEDADFLVELSNYLVEGTTDRKSLAPDAYGNTTPLRLLPFSSPASHALFEYGEKMRAERIDEPKDDLVTKLVMAEVDGDKLTHTEFRNFFHVVVFAGNETTRTAMTQAALAFSQFPEQWDKLVANPDLVDSAVEEILRWGTPVLHMRRTVTEDTELAGTKLAKGDKVVMWYCSANMDETVFDNPADFVIDRPSNTHAAFGGGGPHFCLGAYLARMEIRVLLEEMIKLNLKLSPAGPANRARSNFVNGVLSVDFALAD